MVIPAQGQTGSRLETMCFFKWSGIDNRAFQDISRQVYNEDAFCELQRRANIMNGRTHSNVVSMTLNDYRVAPGVMFMTRSDPQLTFSQRSMKLNAVCWEKLGQQKYVEFLYHPVLEVIAVRSCNATNPHAVLWDETKKSGLQLCTSAFSNAVYDKLDWMRKYKFRFRGVTRVRGGEKIIFFFLDEPQILVGKDKKDKKNLDAMDTSDSTVKYIPYKESECGEAAGLTAGIAYPENWQEQVGVSYVLSGEFLEEKNTAVFSLVEGVSLRTQKGMAQSAFPCEESYPHHEAAGYRQEARKARRDRSHRPGCGGEDRLLQRADRTAVHRPGGF